MWAFLPALATVWLPGMRAASVRPTLSGPEQVIDRGAFRLHTTTEGRDAVDAEAIDAALAGLLAGEQAFLDAGWRPLVGDDGAGGSDAIDVYFRSLDVFGYAHPVAAPDGSWSCFLELDPANTVGGRVAESVALHELHHCVQFRYTASAAPWIYEAASTYEQYTRVVDPVLELAVGVLYGERLGFPERRLSAVDGRFEYAGFLWMKYWSERGGPAPERLPALWEALAVEPPDGATPSWERALRAEALRLGTDLPSAFLDHATWNAFTCATDDGRHYDPEIVPCVASVSVPVEPWDGGEIHLTHTDGPYTAAHLALEVPEARPVAVACDGAPGLRFAVVAVDADGHALEKRGDEHGVAEIDVPAGGTLRLVLAGTDAPLDATCREIPPGPAVAASCDTAGGALGGGGSLWALWALRRRRGRRR